MLKKFRGHFFSGLVILTPFFLTVLFIGYLVKLTDAFVVNPVFRLLPLGTVDAQSKIILTKIVIFLCVTTFVACLGFAAEKILLRKILQSGGSFLRSIPVFSNVYISFRDIAQAFFGDKAGVFKRVVFIEYPRKGLYAMGFVTQEKSWELSEKTGKELVSVFLPHPPNPATGCFVFAPREEIIESRVTVEEGIKLVISGGAALPNSRKN